MYPYTEDMIFKPSFWCGDGQVAVCMCNSIVAILQSKHVVNGLNKKSSIVWLQQQMNML